MIHGSLMPHRLDDNKFIKTTFIYIFSFTKKKTKQKDICDYACVKIDIYVFPPSPPLPFDNTIFQSFYDILGHNVCKSIKLVQVPQKPHNISPKFVPFNGVNCAI